jgi:hypothetical protein
MLDEGEDVGEDLAGMVFVGQAVDHRHPRVAGEALDDRLLIGADHDDVAHARDHLGGVLHRFAAPELRIAGIEVDRRAAELVHASLEGEARARAGLLEDHHQRAVLQGPMALVGLEAGLDDARALEDVVEFLAREILELQEMPRRHHDQAPRNSLIRAPSRSPVPPLRHRSSPAAAAGAPPCRR